MTESDRQLDAALDRWKHDREASDDRLAQLQATIAAGVRDDAFRETSSEAELILPSPSRVGRRRVWFALGAAASLLIVLTVRSLTTPQDDLAKRDGTEPNDAPSVVDGIDSSSSDGGRDRELMRLVSLGEQDVAAKSQLFSAAVADFGDQLQWIAESNGDVQLGLDSARQLAADARGSDTGQPLMLRLVLTAKGPEDVAPRKMWAKDVLARNEAAIEGLPGPGKLHLWCYTLPDGLISVETELTLESPIEGRYVFSSLQKPGTPQRVLTVEIDGVEYTLFQTVALLDRLAELSTQRHRLPQRSGNSSKRAHQDG